MNLDTLASLALLEQERAEPVGASGNHPASSWLHDTCTESKQPEAAEDQEEAAAHCTTKRRKVEHGQESGVRRQSMTARHKRKPLHPLHIMSNNQDMPEEPGEGILFCMDGLDDMGSGFSHIQQLVVHASRFHAHQEAHKSQQQSKLQVSKSSLPAAEHDTRDFQSARSPPPRCHVAEPPLLACIKHEAQQQMDEQLNDLLDEDAALLAASEGLLCMKGCLRSRLARMKHLREVDDAGGGDVEAYYPAPGFADRRKRQWSWSYMDGQSGELPGWGARAKRKGVGEAPNFANNKALQKWARDKDGKIRQQENMIRERDKTIANLTSQAKSDRRRLDKRISELETELRKQHLLESQQAEDLNRYKSEAVSRRDETRKQAAQLERLRHELSDLHRHKQSSLNVLEDVQVELIRTQNEARASGTYRQELLKYQAEAARYQREADRHAATVLSLQRANRRHVQEREAMLLKLAEMAEQVHQVATLKERTHKMQKILTAITHRAEELRTSSKEADMDAFHTLRDIVMESVKMCESLPSIDSKHSKVVAEAGTETGSQGPAGKGANDCVDREKVPAQMADHERLLLLEKENDLLVSQCKQNSLRMRELEQQLAALVKAQSTPSIWKARVAGGTAGDYHTFTMRTNAQVELPEGTLLSVPKSANMQSSSGSLLSRFHDGDILNFLSVDLNDLSPADRQAAGRLLLNLDMGALKPGELSALLRKLGQVNLEVATAQDVQQLACNLLNVLGLQGAMSLLEDMVNNTPITPAADHHATRDSDETLTFHSTTRRDLNASPLSDFDLISLSRQSPMQASFLGPSLKSSSLLDVELVKAIPGLHSRATGSLPRGAAERQVSPFSAHPLEFSPAAMSAAGNPAAGGHPPHLPQGSRSGMRRIPSSGQATSLQLGGAPFAGGVTLMGGVGSNAGLGGANVVGAGSSLGIKGAGVHGQMPASGNGPSQHMVVPGNGPRAQVHAMTGDGRGGQCVVSIPLEQLSQLAQMGSVPVALVQGLSQLMPRSNGGQKPR